MYALAWHIAEAELLVLINVPTEAARVLGSLWQGWEGAEALLGTDGGGGVGLRPWDQRVLRRVVA